MPEDPVEQYHGAQEELDGQFALERAQEDARGAGLNVEAIEQRARAAWKVMNNPPKIVLPFKGVFGADSQFKELKQRAIDAAIRNERSWTIYFLREAIAKAKNP